jgi:hypothetical protein
LFFQNLRAKFEENLLMEKWYGKKTDKMGGLVRTGRKIPLFLPQFPHFDRFFAFTTCLSEIFLQFCR